MRLNAGEIARAESRRTLLVAWLPSGESGVPTDVLDETVAGIIGSGVLCVSMSSSDEEEIEMTEDITGIRLVEILCEGFLFILSSSDESDMGDSEEAFVGRLGPGVGNLIDLS